MEAARLQVQNPTPSHYRGNGKAPPQRAGPHPNTSASAVQLPRSRRPERPAGNKQGEPHRTPTHRSGRGRAVPPQQQGRVHSTPRVSQPLAPLHLSRPLGLPSPPPVQDRILHSVATGSGWPVLPHGAHVAPMDFAGNGDVLLRVPGSAIVVDGEDASFRVPNTTLRVTEGGAPIIEVSSSCGPGGGTLGDLVMVCRAWGVRPWKDVVLRIPASMVEPVGWGDAAISIPTNLIRVDGWLDAIVRVSPSLTIVSEEGEAELDFDMVLRCKRLFEVALVGRWADAVEDDEPTVQPGLVGFPRCIVTAPSSPPHLIPRIATRRW